MRRNLVRFTPEILLLIIAASLIIVPRQVQKLCEVPVVQDVLDHQAIAQPPTIPTRLIPPGGPAAFEADRRDKQRTEQMIAVMSYQPLPRPPLGLAAKKKLIVDAAVQQVKEEFSLACRVAGIKEFDQAATNLNAITRLALRMQCGADWQNRACKLVISRLEPIWLECLEEAVASVWKEGDDADGLLRRLAERPMTFETSLLQAMEVREARIAEVGVRVFRDLAKPEPKPTQWNGVSSGYRAAGSIIDSVLISTSKYTGYRAGPKTIMPANDELTPAERQALYDDLK